MAKSSCECRLDIVRKNRCEDKKTKHTVNNGRHCCQNFNSRAESTSEALGANFSQKYGDTKTQWYCNDKCNDGGNNGSVNGNGATELAINNIPFDRSEKSKTKLLKRWIGIESQGNKNANQSEQNS